METGYLPYIPEFITVHLGPPDSDAENVTVSFSDYIKNVASSEIYPTWPENAVRANVLAEISFALNRVYTEFYRSRGYDFDITNSTAADQSFVKGREVFENISRITDELFTSYIRRAGATEPLFAVYCDGREVTCDGLSQWGTVDLARAGYSVLDILRTYYGNDITVVDEAPVQGLSESYPGSPLRIGDVGNGVFLTQVRLNRIRRNYPAIPRIAAEDGVFGADDWVFTMRVMAKVKRHATLPDVVYLHRSHPGNVSAAMPMRYIVAMLDAVAAVAAEWCDAPDGPRVPRAEFARSLSSHVQLWGLLLPCLKAYTAEERHALSDALARLRREGLLPFVSAGHALRYLFVRAGLKALLPVFWRRRFRSMAKARANHAEEVG